MASSYQPTMGDKLGLVPVAGQAVAALFLRLLTRPFVGGAKAPTLLKDVMYAALRVNLSNISVGAEQWCGIPEAIKLRVHFDLLKH